MIAHHDPWVVLAASCFRGLFSSCVYIASHFTLMLYYRSPTE
jgi:hypothetical protein